MNSVRDKIRARIMYLGNLAKEAADKDDQQTLLNSIIRINECQTILKLLRS